MPLNSLTLSRHTESPENEDDIHQEPSEEKQGLEMRVKQPWWQSLPPNKNKKNQVILEEYDKLKSSLPEWPWIEALKSAKNEPALTRKNVKGTYYIN